MKTLLLQKRGADFNQYATHMNFSDIGNYRVVTKERITDKSGKKLFIEFIHGACWRFTNKRTGKPLKHPKIQHYKKLYINTEFETKDGCFRDLEAEKEISGLNLLYTKAGILEAVNRISSEHYTEIEFC